MQVFNLFILIVINYYRNLKVRFHFKKLIPKITNFIHTINTTKLFEFLIIVYLKNNKSYEILNSIEFN
jgi:hypothetical protein